MCQDRGVSLHDPAQISVARLGKPSEQRFMAHRRRSTGWPAVVIAVAVTAACYAPASDDADSSAPSYLPLLESSKQRLAADDARGAIDELMQAAEIVETMADEGASDCPFAESTIGIADQMLEREHHAEARLAYAIAIRHAEACPHLDRNQLQARQAEAASGVLSSS
jgi:hypothetical protein